MIIDDLSVFVPRVFESQTIELNLNNKKLSVTSVYRPPTPPPNVSITDHITYFSDHLDNLLSTLSQRYHSSYICLDSNINQLITHINHPSNIYFQTISGNGFVQTIHKATRIVNRSHSLIDHILTNDCMEIIKSGTVILDISDHFMTFIQLPNSNAKTKVKQKLNRIFSHENVENFKENLQNQSWETVLNCYDVNESYNLFRDTFKFYLT
jgi:hypothetical protein